MLVNIQSTQTLQWIPNMPRHMHLIRAPNVTRKYIAITLHDDNKSTWPVWTLATLQGAHLNPMSSAVARATRKTMAGRNFFPPAPNIWSAAAINMGWRFPTTLRKLAFIVSMSRLTGARMASLLTEDVAPPTSTAKVGTANVGLSETKVSEESKLPLDVANPLPRQNSVHPFRSRKLRKYQPYQRQTLPKLLNLHRLPNKGNLWTVLRYASDKTISLIHTWPKSSLNKQQYLGSTEPTCPNGAANLD
jgi:hypothetical protein